MATSKTLTPTNVTISIPAMTDVPDASVFSNCVDKEADAINALKSSLRTKIIRVVKTYSNVVIPPSDNYVKIDSYSGLNVPSSYYCISMTIRGWSSANLDGVILTKGQTGTDFYVAGPARTLGSITVEYFFTDEAGSLS